MLSFIPNLNPKVLSSSTGADSEMTVHVAMQLAKSYIHAAQFNQANKILSSSSFTNPNKSNKNGVTNAIKAQQLLSAMFLLQRNPNLAGVAAETSSVLCEAQDSQDIDITVHAASYGLKGKKDTICICNLLLLHVMKDCMI